MRFIFVLFLSIFPALLFSLTISPRENNWNDTYTEKSIYKTYPDNKISVTLKENEYLIDEYTDLLIHFNERNNKKIVPYIGNYSILEKNYSLSPKNKVFGAAAAKFTYKQNLRLSPRKGAIFNNAKYLGSFTIEFWAKHSLLSDGENIFKRYGPVIKDGKVLKYSGIICLIKNKKINWEFHNLFHLPKIGDPGEEKEGDMELSIPLISIKGKTTLKTSKWNHHAITFDNISGKLTYYLNGKEETSVFVTKSGQPEDSILNPKFYEQEKLPIVIGENFYGYIDEFAISKTAKIPKQKIITDRNIDKRSYFNITPYTSQKGIVTSIVYNLKNKNSKLTKVQIDSKELNNSYISYQYRISEDFFAASEDDAKLSWQDINQSSADINGLEGQYFQWRAILTAGYNGKYTPVLNNISFDFLVDDTPKAPKYLLAESKDGKVMLHWPASMEKDIKAYKIYYGIETGNYLASKEPIELKKANLNEDSLSVSYEIPDLKINKMYYFVVSAIDANYNESKTSPEATVIVRR